MKHVFFYPWVGSCYYSGINGKKIMIMGHVHVCGGCDNCGDLANRGGCADFTINTVEKYIKWRETGEVPSVEYKGWLKTYLNFAKSFFGYEPDVQEERNILWNKILFYNYVQTSVPEWNVKPKKMDYKNSQRPFIDVINEYEPDVVFVWGRDAYNNAPTGGTCEKPVIFENTKAERYIYTLNSGKQCTMIKIHHPSMCFSYPKWHEIIKSVIGTV